MAKKFIVTEEHLKLLSKAYVGWNDCEYGAPEIDPKRPYGNSDVEQDIRDILEDDFEGKSVEGLSSSQITRYRKLHKETQTVLTIILSTRIMEAGTYVLDSDYGTKWRKA